MLLEILMRGLTERLRTRLHQKLAPCVPPNSEAILAPSFGAQRRESNGSRSCWGAPNLRCERYPPCRPRSVYLVRSSSFDRARCIHWPAAVLAGDVVNVTTIPVA